MELSVSLLKKFGGICRKCVTTGKICNSARGIFVAKFYPLKIICFTSFNIVT